MISQIIQSILHLDVYLEAIVQTYGTLIYAFLFLIIFMETGFVVTPFLPGDSLLFASGALSAIGSLNILTLFILLSLAAILGDTVNYWIGKKIGRKAFRKDARFLNHRDLEKTQKFYDKHGGKTIILARFIPVVRTLAPFVAGVGAMDYPKFLSFNIIGGILWVSIFLFSGYFFGNIPFVKNNFELVIIGIILVSIIPIVYEKFVKKPHEEDGAVDVTTSKTN